MHVTLRSYRSTLQFSRWQLPAHLKKMHTSYANFGCPMPCVVSQARVWQYASMGYYHMKRLVGICRHAVF